MTDRTQFEAMLEALINEDQETAKEIFHNIVVAKSREIYEELLAEDFASEEVVSEEEEDDEEMEEAANPFDDSEEEDDEEESDADIGGDAGDDFVSDVSDEEDEEGEEDHHADVGGDEEIEDRVMDLEDALDELKAEFEELMAGEENEPEMGADDMGGMDMEPEMDGDMAAKMPEEMDELQQFMEYVDKVALPKHGDNGANAKSVVAGKNDMGGTTANIAKSFSTEKGGTEGGLLKPSTTVQDGGNINKPGANAGKTAFKKKETAAKAGEADNKKSIVGSRK
jgi:hypothetical protein